MEQNFYRHWPPVLGISGFSKCGKTTLLEMLIHQANTSKHWQIMALKKHGHGMHLEDGAKDSFRFHQSGADSFLHDITQLLVHTHHENSLEMMLEWIPGYYDIILVEGHRHAEIPKLWLTNSQKATTNAKETSIPHDPYILTVLPEGKDRAEQAWAWLESWMENTWRQLPLAIGIYGQEHACNRQTLLNTISWAKNISQTVVCFIHKSTDLNMETSDMMPILAAADVPGWWLPIDQAFRLLPQKRWLFVPPDLCENPDTPTPFFSLPAISPGTWAMDVLSQPTSYAGPDFCYGLYYPQIHACYHSLMKFAQHSTSCWWDHKLAGSLLGSRLQQQFKPDVID